MMADCPANGNDVREGCSYAPGASKWRAKRYAGKN